MREDVKVEQVAYHRNGVGGVGFYAVTFTAEVSLYGQRDDRHPMVAIVFDTPGECAVLAVEPLATEVGVTFGENSWRGDAFEPTLRAAIAEHEKSNAYAAGSVRVGPFSIPTKREG